MKGLFLTCMLFITNLAFGQIKIDKAGNGWDLKIDSALQLIKEVDIEKFQLIDSVCDRVEFWSSGFSSNEGSYGNKGTILVAVKGRAIGIGVLGWHTFLQEKGIPFAGLQANSYTRIMSQFIEEGALKASRDQAKEYGEPEWCKGTGLRHTHHLAIAPTVSNANISGGVSPSIEPILSHKNNKS